MTINKMNFTTTVLLLVSMQLSFGNTLSGSVTPTSSGGKAIQKQINQNIAETQKNLKACRAYLKEINEIHEKIQYKLDHFEELAINSRLEMIRQDIQKYETELKNEKNKEKRAELKEIIEAIKEVSKEIQKEKK